MVASRCFTYNHAPYIEDTLRGFAMQKTSFPTVSIIVDDASTDGEQDVLKKWADDNLISDGDTSQWIESSYGFLYEAPLKDNAKSLFVILLLKENHYKPEKKGKKVEYIAKWQESSKYIALCEGDDYWNDPLKIQKQVEVLEANISIGMCYTKCRYYYQGQSKFANKTWGGKAERFDELICENTVPTPSVVYLRELRKQYDKEINPFSRGWMLGDYPFWLWLSKEYGVRFIDNETCVYRVLEHSASQRDDKEKRRAFISSVSEIQHFFADRYNQSCLVPEDKRERAMLMDSFSNKDYHTVIKYYRLLGNPGIKETLKYIIALLIIKFTN